MPMETHAAMEIEGCNNASKFDDDGRDLKRTGTLATATAHIITAVIGSGVLSLAWSTAQLGWIAGSIALFGFSGITWFASILLADCYRSPDPVTGKGTYTYMEVVRTILGGRKFQICGIAQYAMLVGASIAYTITASISMVAVRRSNCFHKNHKQDGCHTSNNLYIIMFGVIQVVLSQIPNFHELSVLSIIAATMSFTYSFIGLGLSIAKIAGGNHPKTSITGVPIGPNMSGWEKMWRSFSALGNIAFAYDFSTVLVSIQDTLKPSLSKNKVMKQATSVAISISSFFYILCGVLGYAAFGNDAPGNLLTGFGFYEPFWLIDFANVCIVVQLVGAYQVFTQPFYEFVEEICKNKWPASEKLNITFSCGGAVVSVSLYRLVWRTSYVVLTTVVAMIFPNFNDVVGLLGAASFWPLTVYFPTEMYIVQARVPRYSWTWIWLKILSGVCFIITLVAAAASVRGLFKNMHTFKPLQSES